MPVSLPDILFSQILTWLAPVSLFDVDSTRMSGEALLVLWLIKLPVLAVVALPDITEGHVHGDRIHIVLLTTESQCL